MTAGPTMGGDDNGDPMVTVDPSAGPTAAGGDDNGIRGVPTEGPTTVDCEADGSASGHEKGVVFEIVTIFLQIVNGRVE